MGTVGGGEGASSRPSESNSPILGWWLPQGDNLRTQADHTKLLWWLGSEGSRPLCGACGPYPPPKYRGLGPLSVEILSMSVYVCACVIRGIFFIWLVGWLVNFT